MIKVGVDKIAYHNLKYDANGWADASKYLPKDYDLVWMKIEHKRNKSGWINGKEWNAIGLKDSDVVLYWKRRREEPH